MAVSIPHKKYFRIGEVSSLTGLEPHVLRFWETEFRELSPRKDGGNQRLYTHQDVETILEIKRLLYEEHFTIAGARKRLEEPEGGAQSDSVADEFLKERLRGVKEELEAIRKLLL